MTVTFRFSLYSYLDIDYSKINHYSGIILLVESSQLCKTTCTTKQKSGEKKQELEEFIRFSYVLKSKQATSVKK
jgi:hypothetical protein